jgi:hypothetical protein
MKCPELIIHRLFSAVAQEIASNDRAQYQFLGHLFQRSNLHNSTKRRKSATRRKICVFELAHMVGDLPRKPNLTSRLQRPSTELNGGLAKFQNSRNISEEMKVASRCSQQ